MVRHTPRGYGLLGLALAGTTLLFDTHSTRSQTPPTLIQTPLTLPLETLTETPPSQYACYPQPVYALEPPQFDIPDLHCSRYARLAAQALFNLTYQPANAWNMGATNHVLWNKNTSPQPFHEVIAPGHLLGIYNPSSRYNSTERPYTHIAFYAGNDTIFHQYGDKILKSNLTTLLKENNLTLTEIITPQEKH